MARTGHPNFDYTCQGTWRGKLKTFSITGNHSGTSFGATDAKAFMEGATSPYALSFAPFQATSIAVVQSRYYDGQNPAPVYEAVYNESNPAPAPLVPTGTAFSGGGDADFVPLEVCVMLAAPCGFSSTSKPIYLRKYLRGGCTVGFGIGSGGETKWTFAAPATAAAKSLGDGSWYQGRVYISPNARQASADWQAMVEVYNHQVPRGRKRKVATVKTQSEVQQLLNLLLKPAPIF